jgi:hypothetical protein
MPVLTYRGKAVTDDEVAVINKLIADNPKDSRRALSVRLCHLWGWTQTNGHTRDMVCRGLMLALHRSGHIFLPPPRQFSGQMK